MIMAQSKDGDWQGQIIERLWTLNTHSRALNYCNEELQKVRKDIRHRKTLEDKIKDIKRHRKTK